MDIFFINRETLNYTAGDAHNIAKLQKDKENNKIVDIMLKRTNRNYKLLMKKIRKYAKKGRFQCDISGPLNAVSIRKLTDMGYTIEYKTTKSDNYVLGTYPYHSFYRISW